MNIKQLNEAITKLLEEYGEDAELNWADDYEELDSTDHRSMYLCSIGNKYCIAVVEYNQAGDADFCDRSNLFDSKKEALKFYKENKSSI